MVNGIGLARGGCLLPLVSKLFVDLPPHGEPCSSAWHICRGDPRLSAIGGPTLGRGLERPDQACVKTMAKPRHSFALLCFDRSAMPSDAPAERIPPQRRSRSLLTSMARPASADAIGAVRARTASKGTRTWPDRSPAMSEEASAPFRRLPTIPAAAGVARRPAQNFRD
jgi:hypothetical protein